MHVGQHIIIKEERCRTLISGPIWKIKALVNKMVSVTYFTCWRVYSFCFYLSFKNYCVWDMLKGNGYLRLPSKSLSWQSREYTKFPPNINHKVYVTCTHLKNNFTKILTCLTQQNYTHWWVEIRGFFKSCLNNTCQKPNSFDQVTL